MIKNRKTGERERGLKTKRGKTIVLPIGLIKILENSRNSNRLIIVISKKTVSSAVKRNRIKRILREAFRQASRFFAKRGYDVVVICKKDISRLRLGEVKNILEPFWG